MNSVFLICMSLLVSAGTGADARFEALPFSVDEVIQSVSQKADRVDDDNLPLQKPHAFSGALEEFMIDTSIIYQSHPYDQRSPSVAFGGAQYLVVWSDGRTGTDADIYGARVDSSGAVLDPSGIMICTAVWDQMAPSVASDGKGYLVVWTNQWTGDIYGGRVDSSGAVLDPSGIAICDAGGSQSSPSVAFGGSTYFVVWSDRRSGFEADLYGARMDSSGTVLDPSGIIISDATGSQSWPSVAFDGSRHLVVWSDARSGTDADIYGARVNTSGTVLDTSGIAISTAAEWQMYPSVAFDGTRHLVVWSDGRSGIDGDIYGARVDTSGTVFDSSGMVISSAAEWQGYPSVTSRGDEYLVVWQDYRSGSDDIYGARVDTSGTVLDGLGIEISAAAGSQGYPSVGFDGTNYFVVWEDERDGMDGDIYGARLSTSGVVLDTAGINVTTAANMQIVPSVASDGVNYLVAWQDYRSGSSDIYATRVDSSGTVLDPSGIAVCTVDGYQVGIGTSFIGSNYVVVWEDHRDADDWNIYCARVDTSGALLDPAGIVVSSDTGRDGQPCVACAEINCLIVWRISLDPDTHCLYGARISPSGEVLDPSGIEIDRTTGETMWQFSPCVASGDFNYLVAWSSWSPHTGEHIYGAIVDTSGDVPRKIWFPSDKDPESAPAAAFDGTNYLVVWTGLGWDYNIFGSRVDTTGTVLDPWAFQIEICKADGKQDHASVTFDGDNYVVVWHDYRSDVDWDIYGTTVDTSGMVVDPLGFELINQPYYRIHPVAASGAGDQMLLAYYGFEPEPYSSVRVFGALCHSVGVEENAHLVTDISHFKLQQNFPNPFSRVTDISFVIPSKSAVSLNIYDSSGRLVNTLVDEDRPAGSYAVTWEGKDRSGSQAPSGVYFYKLQAGEFTSTGKMILLR